MQKFMRDNLKQKGLHCTTTYNIYFKKSEPNIEFFYQHPSRISKCCKETELSTVQAKLVINLEFGP